MMPSLTSKQRAHLRKLAHRLKPVVIIGNDGVTDAVVQAVTEALSTRELLKVKALDTAPGSIREAADALAAAIPGAHVAQTIGRTAALYRPDPEQPEIVLPRASG